MIQSGKVVVEPSGAAPLAVLMQHKDEFHGQRVGVIISGGNMDPQLLSEILAA